MNTMKLTEKSNEVYTYVKENGGKVSVDELCEALGRAPRSINANITDLCSEKKGLAMRVKEEVEGAEKPITYVVLTDAGLNFVPTED
jgi:predicted transcriptional regulator